MLETLLLALRDFFFLFSYISGRNSFPKPLPAPEEADCIDRMIAGEKAAQDRLIEHNLRLVAHIAKKFQNTGLEYDDMISIGTIGLIKAVSTYKKGGTALATYAARCIENAILTQCPVLGLKSGKMHLSKKSGTFSATLGFHCILWCAMLTMS